MFSFFKTVRGKITFTALFLFFILNSSISFAFEFKYDWCDFKFTYPKDPKYILSDQVGLPAIVEFDEGKYKVIVTCEMNNIHIIPNKAQMCKNRKEGIELVAENAKMVDCIYGQDKHSAHTLVLAEIPYQKGGNFLKIEVVYISKRNRFVVSLLDFGLSDREQFKTWESLIGNIEWVGN